MLGQSITCIGTGLIYVPYGEICDRWFSIKQRPIAYAMVILIGASSSTFNTIIPSAFITNNKTVSKEQVRMETLNFIYFRTILPVICFVIILIFFKENPKKKEPNVGHER